MKETFEERIKEGIEHFEWSHILRSEAVLSGDEKLAKLADDHSSKAWDSLLPEEQDILFKLLQERIKAKTKVQTGKSN